MKAIRFDTYGSPHQVCRCVDIDPPGPPGEGEVVVAMEACPINPADLLMIEDRYPGPESLPAFLGVEGVGSIVAVGDAVSDLAAGDRVMSMARTNWAEQVCLKAEQAIKVPEGIDVLQLSMLKVNPSTALLMLREYVRLKPGDWIVQNAANSAVGHHVVRLAQRLGCHSINVVRRPEVIDRLVAAGADMVLLDGDDLGERVRAQTEGAPVKLAIDAVGGTATTRLADCLDIGGTVVNYGFLSGEACQMTPLQLVTRGISLTGFWLVKFLSQMSRSDITEFYSELAGYCAEGTLDVAVAATFGLDEIEVALRAAEGSDRDGKILLLPNGPVI